MDFNKILEDFLSKDDKLRKAAEAQISELRSQPNDLVLSLVDVSIKMEVGKICRRGGELFCVLHDNKFTPC